MFFNKYIIKDSPSTPAHAAMTQNYGGMIHNKMEAHVLSNEGLVD